MRLLAMCLLIFSANYSYSCDVTLELKNRIASAPQLDEVALRVTITSELAKKGINVTDTPDNENKSVLVTLTEARGFGEEPGYILYALASASLQQDTVVNFKNVTKLHNYVVGRGTEKLTIRSAYTTQEYQNAVKNAIFHLKDCGV